MKKKTLKKKTSKKPKREKTAKEKLNLNQRAFCELFVIPAKEFFGNGTACYIEVYKPEKKGNWYNVARARASHLLSSINVYTYINELLEEGGLNDQNVDKQLLLLVNQHSDFKTKLGAIREYNALKQRIRKKLELEIERDLSEKEQMALNKIMEENAQ